MIALFALAAFSTARDAARPIPLDRITLDLARRLHGKTVLVEFVVGKPCDYWRGRTIVGTADHPDDTERGAHLAGTRPDIEVGRRAVIVGTLRVLHQPPASVGGRFVAGWIEIRVEEVRHAR